ncbi:hypothetical protein FDP41_009334 [Naegleria fowleri]|uniref:Uncharacterized protein n=1 Tax=Naegleria fowleri TaxID=5763 RepID=A0A6A5BCP5_NAEFO|nr:uncharacterized protein FDP41_009334 [Naegleria fowleri]KAF0972431.1 hypothetical protein FDP41_009334 [Naegleria fowleri]CAG4717598.1 unnamed protein product [Naegleria fowleri]
MLILRFKKLIIGGAVSLGVGYQQKKDYDSRKTLAVEFLMDRPSLEEDDDDDHPHLNIGSEEANRIAREAQQRKLLEGGTPTKDELHKILQEQLKMDLDTSFMSSSPPENK